MLSLKRATLGLNLVYSLAILTLFLDCSVLGIYSLSASNYFALKTTIKTTITIDKRPFLSVFTTVTTNVYSNFIATVLRAGLNISDLLTKVVIGATLCSIGVTIVKNSSLVGVGEARAMFSVVGRALGDAPLGKEKSVMITFVTMTVIVIFLMFFLEAELNLTVETAKGGTSVMGSSSVGPMFAAVMNLYITGSFATLSKYLLSRSRGSMSVGVKRKVIAVTLTSLLVNNAVLNENKVFIETINVMLKSFVFHLMCAITLEFGVPTFVLGLMSSIVIILTVSNPCLGGR